MEIFLSYVKCSSLLNIVCFSEVFISLPKTHQSFTNIQYSENEIFFSYLGSQFAKISNSQSVRCDVDLGLNVSFQHRRWRSRWSDIPHYSILDQDCSQLTERWKFIIIEIVLFVCAYVHMCCTFMWVLVCVCTYV